MKGLFRTRKALLKVINDLEDENKKLKEKNEFLTDDNVKLLNNARELRATIRGLENLLENYNEKEVEVLENKPKRRGRPKKEAN